MNTFLNPCHVPSSLYPEKNTLSDTVLEARTGKSVTKTHCPFPGGTENTSEDYFEIAELM